MKLFFVKFILFFVSSIWCFGNNPNLDSLYKVLEKTIEKRKEYELVKEKRIEAFKQSLNSGISFESQYEINNKIIAEYSYYNLDSTLKYLEINLSLGNQLKNDSYIQESNLLMARRLMNSGREIEAIKVLGAINATKLSDRLLRPYYRLKYEINNHLSKQSLLESHKQHYNYLCQNFYDSLLSLFKKGSVPYLELMERDYFNKGEIKKSLELNTQRLSRIDPNSEFYPQITYYRAIQFLSLNNTGAAKEYFIKTAVYDIKMARKNNAALSELALILYREKKFDRANKYINIAMQDARFFNSNYRFLFLSKALPVINEAYQKEINGQKKNLQYYSIISSSFAILFLVAVILLYVQFRKLAVARNELKIANTGLKDFNEKLNASIIKLKESNHVKEQYIANFLEICSKYIDKLDNYRKMVHKEIANRKVAELFQATKSQRFIEQEQDEFYRNFDNTFLTIYPNFVEKINELLLEEEQIVLKPDELLNSELRILALTRLGIVDSSKIARLLRYSVNTIYNYRAQLKNKAKGDRELFEQKILEIGAGF